MRKLDELRRQLALGVELDAGRVTLETFSETWLTDVKGDSLKASTRETYRDLLKLHILPHLGAMALDKLQPRHVLAWLSHLKRRKVGAATRRSAFVLLHGILGTAVRHNMVAFNPCDRVERPKAPATRRAALEPAQVHKLLAAARKHDAEAMVALAVLHGLRFGEVTGLCWRDIDFSAGLLRVERQLSEVRRSGARSLETPKSAASVRDVPLSQLALDAVRRHRAKLDPAPQPTELCFQSPDGGPIRRSNWHRRRWVKIREAASLPDLRFHDCRHAAASALLGAGADVATTAATLGHSSPAVTLRVYSHAVPSRQRDAADRVDALYGPAIREA